MPPTYHAALSAFTHFLTAYTHTLLYLRHLYPPTSFARSRFHNTPVHQSRHPLVCEWIRDAIAAVRDELLAGTVARIGIVIFSYGGAEAGATGSVRIMERYMVDVSSFPVVEKGHREMEIEWAEEREDSEEDSEVDSEEQSEHDEEEHEDTDKGKHDALDADVHVDLSEQFRAALIALTTRTAQLAPLPPQCSFNISMELKDEGDADPPIGHPQAWVPVQPSLQKTGRKGKLAEHAEGQDLGGTKATPVRTVEAGVFRFEAWIEEAKAKFETADRQSKISSAS